MKSVHTQPDIEFIVTNGIGSWLSNGLVSFELDTFIESVILFTLKYQFLLGWDTLLHGFISKKIMIFQQGHYSEISSHKVSSRWGFQLTHRLWTIIKLHWNHKNSVLNESEAIDILSGVGQLTVLIINEYEQGLGELPSVYTTYLLAPLAFILQKPTAYLKMWFLVIRSGR